MMNGAQMLNAERMWSDSNSIGMHSIGVIATLKSDFTFQRLDGEYVTLLAGTLIHVDEDRAIGNVDDDYFSVEPSDYTVSYSN